MIWCMACLCALHMHMQTYGHLLLLLQASRGPRPESASMHEQDHPSHPEFPGAKTGYRMGRSGLGASPVPPHDGYGHGPHGARTHVVLPSRLQTGPSKAGPSSDSSYLAMQSHLFASGSGIDTCSSPSYSAAASPVSLGNTPTAGAVNRGVRGRSPSPLPPPHPHHPGMPPPGAGRSYGRTPSGSGGGAAGGPTHGSPTHYHSPQRRSAPQHQQQAYGKTPGSWEGFPGLPEKEASTLFSDRTSEGSRGSAGSGGVYVSHAATGLMVPMLSSSGASTTTTGSGTLEQVLAKLGRESTLPKEATIGSAYAASAPHPPANRTSQNGASKQERAPRKASIWARIGGFAGAPVAGGAAGAAALVVSHMQEADQYSLVAGARRRRAQLDSPLPGAQPHTPLPGQQPQEAGAGGGPCEDQAMQGLLGGHSGNGGEQAGEQESSVAPQLIQQMKQAKVGWLLCAWTWLPSLSCIAHRPHLRGMLAEPGRDRHAATAFDVDLPFSRLCRALLWSG